MPSTDIDGTNLMIIGENATVAIIVGDRTYRGVLRLRKTEFQESWYLETPEGEVQIHKIERS
jgi:hypothetical protein